MNNVNKSQNTCVTVELCEYKTHQWLAFNFVKYRALIVKCLGCSNRSSRSSLKEEKLITACKAIYNSDKRNVQ